MEEQSVLSSKSHITPCSSSQPELGSSSGQVEAKTQKRKAGRKKFQETRHPVYKGVRRRNGKWVSELREPIKKSRIWLGTFSSPGMAARAYDAAALALKGDSASLNFPESANALPRARSSSIRDIQYAAMEAAEAFGDIAKTPSPSPSLSSSSSLPSPPLPSLENSSENVQGSSEKLFLDEEEVFNMPGILDSMAEGLILTPPAMQKGYYNWDDDVDDYMEFTLWGD
ncbi:Dehydration-responsive element-binding protein 1B, putative [Theobroma cacao]|uniref:Dehydration-responsive element-binding protein 1B, putative n=1 Tax=Theobroma cacao TaxID=3641 RepID=A0A061EUS7_THECC|nr:Dehydration-responsive element-binding protein 1B, putative [Theobroma cacao]